MWRGYVEGYAEGYVEGVRGGGTRKVNNIFFIPGYLYQFF